MPPASRKKSADRPEPQPAKPGQAPPATGELLSLRLPFVSVSVGRPAPGPRSGGSLPGTPRLLFYGGVAALGVAGLVDWPVAAAIAAGTYLASRLRTPAPPAGASGHDPAGS